MKWLDSLSVSESYKIRPEKNLEAAVPVRYLIALAGAADIAALLLGVMLIGSAVLVAMLFMM
jgi:hypothetical protein